MRFDTTVLGAGLIGLAVAQALARAGRTVLLVETLSRPAQVTSSRNSQVLHAAIYYPAESWKARLCLRGTVSLPAWCEAHGVPHRRVGKLIVATDAQQEEELGRLLAQGRANGVPHLEPVDAAFVKRLEPDVRATAALWSPDTGILDAHALAASFLQEATDHGATLALRHHFEHGERAATGYRLWLRGPEGEAMSVDSLTVVNAAGLHADTVAQAFGLDLDALGYRQHWVKGRYCRVKARGRVTHLVYPVPGRGLAGLGVHLTVGLDGDVRLGPDVEPLEERREDYSVPESLASLFQAAAVAYLPWLTAEDLAPDQAGIRPKLSRPGEASRDFVIAEETAQGLPGLVTLAGLESPGLTASLEVAEEVARLIA